jgi:predicted CoA-binding protein
VNDAAIRDLLLGTRRIAVVGASDKPDRAGYYIPAFLIEHGYDVALVNPVLAGRQLHGRTVLGSLAEAAPLELVDVFRRSDQAGQVVDEAIRLGATSVWLQLGVMDDAAGDRARAAGLAYVQDRCPAIEWPRLGLGLGLPPRIA